MLEFGPVPLLLPLLTTQQIQALSPLHSEDSSKILLNLCCLNLNELLSLEGFALAPNHAGSSLPGMFQVSMFFGFSFGVWGWFGFFLSQGAQSWIQYCRYSFSSTKGGEKSLPSTVWLHFHQYSPICSWPPSLQGLVADSHTVATSLQPGTSSVQL